MTLDDSTRSRPATDLFIGGKWRARLGRRPVRRASTRRPATVIASVADGTVEDALGRGRRRGRGGRGAGPPPPRASGRRCCAGPSS